MKLSVVVAAQDGGPELEKCLQGFEGQLPPEEMEILVVTAHRATVDAFERRFPKMRFLHPAKAMNVPLLWTAGIDAAQGDIVALTIENCRPAPDWAVRTLAAHRGDWSCVGGAIEPRLEGCLIDWSVYFCRYSAYLLPFAPELREDVAADNCSYKRAALAAVRPLASDGFWEALIHADMRRRGEKIMANPAPVVSWLGGIRSIRFLRRRYDHGRYFAAQRSRGLSTGQRLIRAIGFPAVPVVLLNRMATRVRNKGRFKKKFAQCLPLIAIFLTAWALGEGAGYLFGYSGKGPTE
ncbi:MAG: hypothetical protein ABJC09_01800 [Terriglobia bacterium]